MSSAQGSFRKTKLVVTLRANVLELSPNCVELLALAIEPSRAFPTVLAGLVWLRNVYVATPIPIPGLTSDRDVSDMTWFPKDNSLLRCLCLVFSLMATSGLCVARVRVRPHLRRRCALGCANKPTKQGMCAKSNTRQRKETQNDVMRGIQTAPSCRFEYLNLQMEKRRFPPSHLRSWWILTRTDSGGKTQ